MQPILTWSNPLPGSVSRELGIIFDSLTTFLSNPSFPYGVNVGDGTTATWNPTTGVANLRKLSSADIPSTNDTTTPATPSIVAHPGLQMVVLSWNPVLTTAGFTAASYVVQLSTDSAFGSVSQSNTPTGPVTSFSGLTAGTTYYVRVAGVSTGGTQGLWSSTASFTTTQALSADLANNAVTTAAIAAAAVGTTQLANNAVTSSQIASAAVTATQLASNAVGSANIQAGAVGATAIAANAVTASAVAAGAIVAGKIATSAIVAGDGVISNAAIASAQIASLAADKITAGTINAQTVQLGASGGTAAIQSTNFVAGSAGWSIRGDGTAEFSNVVVRGSTFSGTVSASTLSGNTITGGSINIGSGAFQVDGSGNLTATAANLTGNLRLNATNTLSVYNGATEVGALYYDSTSGGLFLSSLNGLPLTLSSSGTSDIGLGSGAHVSPTGEVTAARYSGIWSDGASTGGSGGAIQTHQGNALSFSWETLSGGGVALTLWIDTTHVITLYNGSTLGTGPFV